MRPISYVLPLIGLLSGIESQAAVGSATVVVLRGSAKLDSGKTLAEKDKVDPGATVVTSARSFVRLLFSDNTQLNVGPDTTMKIEVTKPGEASIVDLVGGQIRAKVTKDPLANHDADAPVKEKMLVKTKTAAMGIRGTDFNVSFNQLNNITALITFEGMVAMAKMEPGAVNAMSALHQDKGVQSVGAGQFSGVQPDQAQASIPVKISPAQLETLKGNSEFKGLGAKQEKQAVMASPVPPGVDPKGFSSGSEKSLKEAVAKSVGEGKLNQMMADSRKGEAPAGKVNAPPEGFLNKATGEYAPRAGGFIDLSSGRYVPPPAGSSFDPNTGVFVPPRAMGSVDPSTGMYVPPKGVDLDPVKGFVAEAKPAAGAPDGSRVPSSPGAAGAGLPPPPPPAVLALVTAMNTQSSPENSTKTVTMDSSFSGGGSAVNGGQTTNALPPPPNS
ncbi:MAG: FecR family protein, partial [Bdellovibrionota bacterium]